MQEQQNTDLYQPETITDGLNVLSDLGSRGKVLAGGTWIMRSPLLAEPLAQTYVAIARIPELHQIDFTDIQIKIGSGVTHAQLARELQAIPEMRGLVAAAGGAANPAVRQAATVGGNLCTINFAAADLVPAFLCHDAEVEFESVRGRQRIALEDFLRIRNSLPPEYLLLHVLIPIRPVISTHARLPLRKAGDYPVAIVSVSVERRPDGVIGNAAIGVGSVEAVARRWRSLERAIVGLPLHSHFIYQHALELADEFAGRDGPEVPGWYRIHVLPTLVRRAFEDLQKHELGRA